MRFPVSSARLNQQETAIVQQATRTCAYYETELANNAKNRDRILLEWSNSGCWKEKYQTWTAACEANDISVSQANRIISSIRSNGALCVELKMAKKEEKALSRVEKARETPKEEESDKPAVHSADEQKRDEPKSRIKPENNGHTPAADNGKPKSQLAVWKQAADCGGAFLRSIDALHRVCPNESLRNQIVSTIKTQMSLVEAWRTSVK